MHGSGKKNFRQHLHLRRHSRAMRPLLQREASSARAMADQPLDDRIERNRADLAMVAQFDTPARETCRRSDRWILTRTKSALTAANWRNRYEGAATMADRRGQVVELHGARRPCTVSRTAHFRLRILVLCTTESLQSVLTTSIQLAPLPPGYWRSKRSAPLFWSIE